MSETELLLALEDHVLYVTDGEEISLAEELDAIGALIESADEDADELEIRQRQIDAISLAVPAPISARGAVFLIGRSDRRVWGL